MTPRFSRTDLARRRAAALGDPDHLAAVLADTDLPASLAGWLARLMLLQGVTVNYLVPDEAMLPPESIRFFYVDMSWVDALVDGAFSIGRNLTTAADSASHAVDRAVRPTVHAAVRDAAPSVRAAAFGVEPAAPSLEVVSGFLLRSKVVQAHRGLGVTAYAQGAAPTEPLTVLRLEQLGAQSDTIVCLVDGDAVQLDLHEPPESLHYGVTLGAGPVVPGPSKTISRFTRGTDGASITFEGGPVDVPGFDACFRAAAPRTLRMAAVAEAMAQVVGTAGPQLDSAEMGFEMTEGVGMVSFVREGPAT